LDESDGAPGEELSSVLVAGGAVVGGRRLIDGAVLGWGGGGVRGCEVCVGEIVAVNGAYAEGSYMKVRQEVLLG
jgi:hypothetical protein